jgi:hypothetical protein
MKNKITLLIAISFFVGGCATPSEIRRDVGKSKVVAPTEKSVEPKVVPPIDEYADFDEPNQVAGLDLLKVDEFGFTIESKEAKELKSCEARKVVVARTAMLVVGYLNHILHNLANNEYYQARFRRAYKKYSQENQAERANLTVQEDLLNFMVGFK